MISSFFQLWEPGWSGWMTEEEGLGGRQGPISIPQDARQAEAAHV